MAQGITTAFMSEYFQLRYVAGTIPCETEVSTLLYDVLVAKQGSHGAPFCCPLAPLPCPDPAAHLTCFAGLVHWALACCSACSMHCSRRATKLDFFDQMSTSTSQAPGDSLTHGLTKCSLALSCLQHTVLLPGRGLMYSVFTLR